MYEFSLCVKVENKRVDYVIPTEPLFQKHILKIEDAC